MEDPSEMEKVIQYEKVSIPIDTPKRVSQKNEPPPIQPFVGYLPNKNARREEKEEEENLMYTRRK